MRLYCVQVDIFEVATKYAFPVVSHRFFGRTKTEARHYHASHRKADAFLRACEDQGVFAKTVTCRAVVTERWVTMARAATPTRAATATLLAPRRSRGSARAAP